MAVVVGSLSRLLHICNVIIFYFILIFIADIEESLLSECNYNAETYTDLVISEVLLEGIQDYLYFALILFEEDTYLGIIQLLF